MRARKTRVGVRKKKIQAKPEIDIDSLVGYCEDGETIQISDRFFDYVILMYGKSGAGKTSMMSKIPGSYTIQCDPNRRGLKIRQTNIPDTSFEDMKANRANHTPWDVFVATMEKILEDDSVQTVVIDNLQILYRHAVNHYCLNNTVDTLQEMNDYGVSWDATDAMYINWLQKIVDSSRGLVIITHDTDKEIPLPDGSEKTQILPDLSKRPYQVIKAITDFAFYLGFSADGRVITLRDDSNDIWVKCCTDESQPRFFDPDGKPVQRISAGRSPQEAWDNLMKSWDNKLHDVTYVPKKGVNLKKKRRRTTN